jgi:hypothetical protein
MLDADPLMALALLPADADEESERRRLQDTLGWLKNAPLQSRNILLEHLCAGLRADPPVREEQPLA